MLTVYSKSNCMQCDATFITLDEAGIEYDVVKIDEDHEALAYVKSLGFASAPVVVAKPNGLYQDHKAWSGFRPDLIQSL